MKGVKNDELYMRYIQFGVFSPINRLHCVSSKLVTKEPGVYMNGTGLIAEEFLRLRHKMIPFLYSASYETYTSGRALIEPMYYVYPCDEEAYSCGGQYMFGDQLIVAPITKTGDSKGFSVTKVWLPKGRWTDIFTGDEYEGNGWTDMVRWRDNLPVLAKEGGFFVLDERSHTNSIENPDDLAVLVFNGNGEYVLHEEADGGFSHTRFVSAYADGVQSVEWSMDGDGSACEIRTFQMQFRNIPSGEVKVYADGNEIAFDTVEDGYITVILENVTTDRKYRIEVSFDSDRNAYRMARTVYVLQRLELTHEHKLKLYKALRSGTREECVDFIENEVLLTRAEKIRLLEAR